MRLVTLCLVAATLGAQTPTFSKEVVRVFQKHCQTCHHPGDIGPFSLMDYQSARPWARSIQESVASGKMPPWKPKAGVGDFRGARILSQQERETIIRWVDGGSPEGDAQDLPQPLTFPDGWALGEPDLILKMDAPYAVPAAGNDIYRCFSLPTNFTEDKFISAVHIRAGNRTVTHHVILFSDPQGASKTLDEQESGQGYTCWGGPGFTPDLNFFGGWAPGIRPAFNPPGMAMMIPKGSRIAMQLHYHPSGEATSDQTEVGLYFSKSPVDKVILTLPLANQTFLLPAGAPRTEVNFTLPLVPFDAHIVSIAPHMHLLGREIRSSLSSGGRVTSLIDIPDWDFNWQGIYDYTVPVAAPFGSRLSYTAIYDNSANNPRNPNSPPKDVRWGEQTTDEMAVIFYLVTMDNEHRIAPNFEASGVVNAASYAGGTLAPGSMASLFGIALGSNWETAGRVPLPRAMGKVRLQVGTEDAPLYYISPSQINFQVPFEVSGAVPVTLTRSEGDDKTATVTINVGEAQPGIFTFTADGRGPAAALRSSGAVGGGNPAARGEMISLYVTGLGRVTPGGRTGEAPASLSRTVNATTVLLAGREIPADFAGLAPGFVGLYQVNFRVPADAPAGDLQLRLRVAGVESNTVLLAVN